VGEGERGQEKALVPVDRDATRACVRNADATLGLALDPLERTLVVSQVGLE
jgi:hypothetical protein